jgi:hypothetical protein
MALCLVAGSLLVGPVEAKAALVSESKVYDATAVNISATETSLVTGSETTLTASAVGLVVDGSAAWNSAGAITIHCQGILMLLLSFIMMHLLKVQTLLLQTSMKHHVILFTQTQ